ncbi:MAG: SpoVR family protein [Planctomycetota bacterium]
MRIKNDLPSELKYQALVTENAARDAGLDFFEVVFELLDAKDVNGVAAYGGFPVRYPSWRFGMDYERLEKGRVWGLSKIYELVINNDPTYAYLVRSNSLMEQKLVMAHVYGHADFFRHNLWFAPTDRKMLDTMGNHSTRLRRYVDALGQDRVERFLDLCLSIDGLVDPYLPLREMTGSHEGQAVYTAPSERARRSLEALSAGPLGPVEPGEAPGPHAGWRFPTYDVLGFLEEHAPLESWERDVLHVVRAEAYYFAPQRMTKIINEGWASFWHSRLLTGGLLDPSEILDFADCHSAATEMGRGSLNPYKVGIELLRHAEARGEDLFMLRRVHNDVSLVDKIVDEEFARRHLACLVGAAGRDIEDWRELKAWVLTQISWGGQPQIQLEGVAPGSSDELLFVHRHDGRDLQLGLAERTLTNLAAVWRRPVHLLTLVEGEGKRLVASKKGVELMDSTAARDRLSAEGDEQQAAG